MAWAGAIAAAFSATNDSRAGPRTLDQRRNDQLRARNGGGARPAVCIGLVQACRGRFASWVQLLPPPQELTTMKTTLLLVAALCLGASIPLASAQGLR